MFRNGMIAEEVRKEDIEGQITRENFDSSITFTSTLGFDLH